MKSKFLIVIVLIINSTLYGNTAFEKGIELYKNNQFPQALEQFASIEKEGLHSSELYYNIGNCYFKSNEIGKAILYYERAKKLNSKDEDIIHNLNFANQLIRDKSAEIIESPIENLLFKKISANGYAAVGNVLLILAALLILSKFFININTKIKLLVIIGCFIISSLSITLSYFTYKNDIKQKYAIVLSSKIEIYTEPKTSSKVTFILHEGSKVEIIDFEEVWQKISFGDGKVGWINSDAIELI